MSTHDEAELLARMRTGDESALEVLMDRYMDDVFSIAFHYVRTADVASDITQEVFVKFWERRQALDATQSIAHYLRVAARNSALKVLRHDSANARLETNISLEHELFYPHTINTGMRAIDAQEFTRELHSALNALSPRVREVALLYHERGLEPGEIAALLGVAPQTVYNQLQTAMKALVKAFKK